ncbi:MAG: MFS transporter [Carboxydocellales bacterium]
MSDVKVNEIIEKGRLNKFFLVTFLVTLATMIFDGYDMNIFGVIVPALMKDMNLNPAQIGLLASYALYGMILGSVLFGMIADKIGRKKAIMLGILVYSVFTGLTGFAQSQTQFGIFRFLAGFGLAGVVPNAIAIEAEYSPQKNRGLLVTLISIGVPVGAMIASGLGMLLLAPYGWRVMLWLAFIPVLLIFVVYYYMPESMIFYVKNGEKDKIRQTLKQANPEYAAKEDDNYVIPAQMRSENAPFATLFKNGLARNTVLFWIAYFMNMFTIFGMQTWLPKMMMLMGYPLGSSLWFLLTFNTGALLGMTFGGWAGGKYGYQKILVSYYIICAICVSLLTVKTNMFLLSIIIFLIGTAILGVQGVINTFVSQSYPLNCRSTALGWANGLGRLGGAVGPTVGGLLLAAKVPMTVNFFVFAVPSIIAAIMIFSARDYTKKVTLTSTKLQEQQ